jgi:hypothetical protein
MDTATIVAALDAEIETLQKAKALLSEGGPMPSATGFAFGENRPTKKRFLSKEARARIAATQKKRWAELFGSLSVSRSFGLRTEHSHPPGSKQSP